MILSLPIEQRQHMYRVGIYVGMLAEKLKQKGVYSSNHQASEYSKFGKAAYFHDIGKIYISNKILSKPGKLTEDEFHIVCMHTVLAIKLLQKLKEGCITGIPEDIISLVYDSAVHHHERWDKGGYPSGIGGEEIPLIARVTALCDTYDAITNDRAYRKRFSHEYACNEIKKCAGTQFDSEIVDVFLQAHQDFMTCFPIQRGNLS